MDFTFRSPLGAAITNAPLQTLRDLILEGDDTYWCAGSGDGSVERRVGSGTAMLSMVFKNPYGFLLRYGMYDSTDDFVAVSSTDYSRPVQASLGGDIWTVPTAFFVSRQAAWEAVEHFCHIGEMSNSLTWVRLAEQQWNTGVIAPRDPV